MFISPYPYQAKLIQEAYQKLESANRIAIIAPTGSGKTIIASFIARDAVKRQKKILFVVHRDRLIPQTQKTLKKLGIRSGVIAGRYEEDRSATVQVASFQTMSGDRDISWFQPDLTFADECHITSFVNVMKQRFPKLTRGERLLNKREEEGILIGLTATPWRLSKTQSLLDYYQDAVFAPMPGELIEHNFLCPISYYHVPDSQGKSMDATIDYLIQQWKKLAQNRLTIAFCPTIEFAKGLAKGFKEIGVTAEAVHSKMKSKECDRIYKDYEDGKIKILSSVGKLTEGFDCPPVSCGITARDTESRALYFQMLGRLARKADGKNDAILLDAVGLSHPDKFGRFEDLKIDESSLYQFEEEAKGDAPIKTCHHCFNQILASYRICPICGSVLDVVGKIKYLPDGEMVRYWANNEERVEFAAYQKLLKVAFQRSFPPEWAGKQFYLKFNRTPPLDWRRNSVLTGGSIEQQSEYKEYLQKVAKSNGLGRNWVYEQLSLELGV
ncbi:MAG: DEAD/DEAH box helicase [Symploca sp. SIO2C1]|nr:DEAD/DEAH box helicase [Symploca sp. SIO2C1]